MGSRQGTSSLQSYFSEFRLVLSSFILRLMASSEHVMVSGGREEAAYRWFLFRGPLLGFSSCLIGQDWVTCPFPNLSLDGSPAEENEIDDGWLRPINNVQTDDEKSTTQDTVRPRPIKAISVCIKDYLSDLGERNDFLSKTLETKTIKKTANLVKVK